MRSNFTQTNCAIGSRLTFVVVTNVIIQCHCLGREAAAAIAAAADLPGGTSNKVAFFIITVVYVCMSK